MNPEQAQRMIELVANIDAALRTGVLAISALLITLILVIAVKQ